jgi:ribosome-binding protein aMBF1 (putative translation factor)
MRQYTRAELNDLKTQILDRGITIENLAKAANVQEALVIEIMKGKLRPSLDVRKSLAEALGIRTEMIG